MHSNEEDDYQHYHDQVDYTGRTKDPYIHPGLGDFPEDQLAESMNGEMASLETFDVYDEI